MNSLKEIKAKIDRNEASMRRLHKEAWDAGLESAADIAEQHSTKEGDDAFLIARAIRRSIEK
tara:strand:- start:284 stop:469 length:186 start_codon:yes stop_codon:yes gene_type:complete